jgi:hypothetical protein
MAEVLWATAIKKRISENKNFLGIFSGSTGSGKTWAAMRFAEMLDKSFLDPGIGINRIIFKSQDFLKLINTELPNGSVIIWDECGIDQGNRTWQSFMNKTINWVLQSFRYKNIIVLFTTPYSDFLDAGTRKLIHAEFRMLTIDRNDNTSLVRARGWQYNSYKQQIYPHMLIVRSYDKDAGRVVKEVIDTFWLRKPSPELVRLYELKRASYMSELYKKAESEVSRINKEEEGEKEVVNAVSLSVANNETEVDLLEGLDTLGISKKRNISLRAAQMRVKAYNEKAKH